MAIHPTRHDISALLSGTSAFLIQDFLFFFSPLLAVDTLANFYVKVVAPTPVTSSIWINKTVNSYDPRPLPPLLPSLCPSPTFLLSKHFLLRYTSRPPHSPTPLHPTANTLFTSTDSLFPCLYVELEESITYGSGPTYSAVFFESGVNN